MEEYLRLHHITKCADASMGEWGSHAATSSTINGAEGPIRRPERGSEWEPIKILLQRENSTYVPNSQPRFPHEFAKVT
jgi:hypothetical protein